MNSEQEWLYVNNHDNSIRYVLGTKGKKTLFCIGINPSVATPEKLDPTLQKVSCIAKYNGYDSFVMFNVYPKRDTNFDDLEKAVSSEIHIKNVEIIIQMLSEYSDSNVWVAFGNHIYDREYLPTCLKDIYNKLPNKTIKWFATGVNKSGAPKHPLYQKKETKLVDFDMEAYIKTI